MRSHPYNLLEEVKTVEASSGSACYFPLDNGRYEVKPGLMPLGSSLGNGEADRQVFQIDGNFFEYRQVKLAARAERLSKYYQTCNYSHAVAGILASFIINRLIQEHPQYFHCQPSTNNTFAFYSQLTGETLYLDADWQLQQFQTLNNSVFPHYTSTLDALATQIQEDLTVICRSADDSNWLSAVHLCYPNHWSASEKIGKDFATIHAPVAGMEKINRRADAIVNTMIFREPMVRFAWGLSTDTRLNHHPEPPSDIAISEWQGRHFDPQHPRLYLRIERQVIWGLPEYEAALFTIRTYFRDCSVIKKDSILRSKLSAAIQSMTPESLIYKGILESKKSILEWLNKI
ncbi:MAG: heme-dependent oxidative N-demethylase family protein [Heteroscytonema crispum UTEX LB 1556]